jgi:molybdate transport system regulatory protein
MTIQISARNQLTGTVSAVTGGSVNSEVILTLPSGDKIVAMVTNTSVTNLGLSVGKPATALVKASSILLLVGAAKLSARNQLTGKVKSVQDGAVNAEVTLELSGGTELVATITLGSRKTLGLVVGSEVTAVIKASSVLLAV